MKVILVAAVARNNAIGRDNDLLWHLPDDFKHFKELTTGNTILMGRKTFESFPKPLPNRIHYIISRQSDYLVPEGGFLFHNIDEAIEYAKEQQLEQIFVIGGGEIYRQTIDKATHLEITWVDYAPEKADAFFPEIDLNIWKSEEKKHHPADEKHKYSFDIFSYQRR